MNLAEKLTSGPIGVGTRVRAETSSMGRPVEMVIEVTGYEQSHRLASSTHFSSMDIPSTLQFEPLPTGMRLQAHGSRAQVVLLQILRP